MSDEGKNFHNGFFARIIRDALCTLPDASGERQTLALEQQVQVVVEYSETGTAVTAQSNIAAKLPVPTEDTFTTVPRQSLLPDTSLQPSTIARNIINVEAKPSQVADEHSAVVSETTTAQSADKTATNFPRNNRAMAEQQSVKKIPLAIRMRDARTSKDHQFVPIVQREESARAPVETVIARAPAVETFSGAITGNPELTRIETASPDSVRLHLQDAPPVIAESAPVLAMHHMVERKTPPPALRIGAVTIRVVDATPEPAVSSRASKPVANSIAVDPIASAESRHFLRTL